MWWIFGAILTCNLQGCGHEQSRRKNPPQNPPHDLLKSAANPPPKKTQNPPQNPPSKSATEIRYAKSAKQIRHGNPPRKIRHGNPPLKSATEIRRKIRHWKSATKIRHGNPPRKSATKTACLIEPLVISNTTAHNIDAHDKLAII